MPLKTEKVFRFENCTVDSARRVLLCVGQPVALNPKTFDLLLFLITHAGRVVTKEELLQALWPDSFVEERNLSQHVFLLRKALAERGLAERLIVTVPGRGYQFAARVEEVDEDTPARPAQGNDLVLHAVQSTTTVVVEEDTAPAGSGRLASNLRSHPRFWLASAAVLLLACGIFVWWWLHRPAPQLRKVVIAEFLNLTGDSSYDGTLKSALEVGLSQSPYIQVMGKAEEQGALATMEKAADTPLLRDTALEVCRRNDYQALINGKIELSGIRYPITMELVSCTTGKPLAVYRAEASGKPVVLDTLDVLAERARRKLGEPDKSIEQFQVPIRAATTFSFEALKDYEIGSNLGENSKILECIPYFQKAVDLDPKFASALASLGTAYFDLGASDKAVGYYKQAYDLSGNVTELERLYIQSNYHIMAEHDIVAGRDSFREWTQLYPEQETPWDELSTSNEQLGDYPAAITAAQRSLKVNVRPTMSYENLAWDYMRANRFADARRTIAEAQALGKDSFTEHQLLMRMAMIENDRGAIEREIAWTEKNPRLYGSLGTQAVYAAAQGRVHRSEELFQSSISDAQKEVNAEVADSIRELEAEMEIELGRTAKALEILNQVKNRDSLVFAVLATKAGDTSIGEATLRKPEQFPRGTFEHNVYLPEIRALLALHRGDAAGAVTDLDPSIPYQLGAAEVIDLRGQALLAARQTAKARGEFQKLIDNPALDDDPYPRYTLAYLGMARAYALDGNTSDSRDEYQKFFALWKDADTDVPVLLQARSEFARLPAVH